MLSWYIECSSVIGLYQLIEGQISNGFPVWKRVGVGEEAWIYSTLAAHGFAGACLPKRRVLL